ncbi:MAG: hypothetical protein ACOX38_06455 [Bacillota bacterium]|jgi:hypothetical protein
MDMSDLAALVVWIVVIFSYVLRIVARGFKQAEEEALKKARHLEASRDAQAEGRMEPPAPADGFAGSPEVPSTLQSYELESVEAEEDYDAWPLPKTRRSLAQEAAEERAYEREVEMAEPIVTGSLGEAGDDASEWSERTIEPRATDVDDVILDLEIETSLEESRVFERELVQEWEADVVSPQLASDGEAFGKQVVSGIIWATVLGPPRCRKRAGTTRIP